MQDGLFATKKSSKLTLKNLPVSLHVSLVYFAEPVISQGLLNFNNGKLHRDGFQCKGVCVCVCVCVCYKVYFMFLHDHRYMQHNKSVQI